MSDFFIWVVVIGVVIVMFQFLLKSSRPKGSRETATLKMTERRKFAVTAKAATASQLPQINRDVYSESALAKHFADEKDRQYANPIFREQFPFVGFDTAHDNRVRPNHFALDYRRIKTVFRHDDMIWKVMHEPLGKECRCSRMAFSQEEVNKRGLTIGRGEDWYGKEVEVLIPGSGKPVTTLVLPDRELAKHPSYAKILAEQKRFTIQVKLIQTAAASFFNRYKKTNDKKVRERILEKINKALSLGEPNDNAVHALGLRVKGEILESNGQAIEAISLYETALKLNPSAGVKSKLARLKKCQELKT